MFRPNKWLLVARFSITHYILRQFQCNDLQNTVYLVSLINQMLRQILSEYIWICSMFYINKRYVVLSSGGKITECLYFSTSAVTLL